MKSYVLAALVACAPFSASAETFGEVFIAQTKLNSLGLDVGKPDGRMGPVTRKALKAAAERYGFEPTLGDMFKYFAVDTVKREIKVKDEAIIQAVKDAVGDGLKDPFSAQYRNFRILPSGRICGEVNAKNTYGAYVGWTTFITHGGPLKIGGSYSRPSVHVDDGETELAAMSCLIDA
ncbi:peptidoglycan-binding protein [Paracoccus kondratievae]|uniref:Peptidoglycan binding-like domain-containing protein n=1 Tax=Paracoccus kondratievae TaxID=135740 RepID=A0AAD3NWY6_9RHOB|nr:peptidoglycan-binding protein [Paracoccus kondratievae]AZV00286.1 peptidoglycan-binding domain-containing protein [Paracoccus phage vB_PkoS_Pkon1]GLK63462.1 hypothetical protein GCM10017635_09320 [Paracoccus kondratievae]